MNKVLTLLLASWFSTVLWGQEASISRNSNLRSEPSTSARILAALPAGAAVTIVSKYPRSGYVRVQTAKDGKTGWVYEKNVKLGESPSVIAPAVPVPAPGSARVGDTSIYPDPKLTPGKADVTVTQENLAENICNKHWTTGQVRPHTSVTRNIKVKTMKAYGFTDVASHFELDHLISCRTADVPIASRTFGPRPTETRPTP